MDAVQKRQAPAATCTRGARRVAARFHLPMSTSYMFFFKMSRHMTLEKRWIASCEAVGRWMPFKSGTHLQQHVHEVPNKSQLAPARPSPTALGFLFSLGFGFLIGFYKS